MGRRRPGPPRRWPGPCNANVKNSHARLQLGRRRWAVRPGLLRVPALHASAVTPSPSPRGELTTQLAVACIGAGIVTTVAVAQGQNPLTALGITLFSAIAAVAVGQAL